MKIRKWNLLGWLPFSTLLAGAILLTPAQAADNDQSESGKLEGTWFTQVTVHDCRTGMMLRTFPALNTFNNGNTVIDTTAGAGPSLRSPGHGKWEKTGPHTYSAISLALLFDAAGDWTGTQKLTHMIRVNGDQNAFTSTVEIFDTGGAVISSGCATAAGYRL